MIHDKYDQLNTQERAAVDKVLDQIVPIWSAFRIPYRGDDSIEYVAEALAVYVFECRRDR